MTMKRFSCARPGMLRVALMTLTASVAATSAFPANAAQVSVVGIESYYGFIPGDTGSVTSQRGRDVEQIYVPTNQGGPTELGIDYTSYANDNGFFFLHHDYCIGTCSVYSATRIEFKVTNNTDQAERLRFDSFTTPGHITMFDPNPSTRVRFDFTIGQSIGDLDNELYSAGGLVTDENKIEMRGEGFNFYDLRQDTLSSGASITQWGVTPINLDLGVIEANSTTTLVYLATYVVQNGGVCVDLRNCSAMEVRFGDPRNNGGVSRMAFASQATGQSQPQVGGSYDPLLLTFDVVNFDAPLPPAPPRTPPVDFSGVNRPNAAVAGVPEPSTWMTLLLGMFFVGGVMRRRRRSRAFA